jgi:Transposase DDE domain group 1
MKTLVKQILPSFVQNGLRRMKNAVASPATTAPCAPVHANFSYQAGTWIKPCGVIAKVQRHPRELYSRVCFIVRNMSRPAERVVVFYNKRGTGEQWIKEGKGAIKWTRLSCRTFAANAVRLQLYALAYKHGWENVGSHPPLACGLPASSENSYHPRQFSVHLGNPG